ncbi:hypothetical protein LOTGIDRAFT_52363, partial [Lottia gigantea]
AENEAMRQEIESLKEELREMTEVKVQAAEYGLQVLEEKQQVEQHYDELESQFERMKIQLDTAEKALNQHHITFKKHHESGIHDEEEFLQETATREEGLRSNISDLEIELKNLNQSFGHTRLENDRYRTAISEMQLQIENLETAKQQLKHDIREYKVRENRNLSDYAELEDENIVLQKQVSQLKQAQVEFEAMKHENKRMQETADDLNSQIGELGNLKRIIEKNLEEALNSLQAERDQKHALKKELDQRMAQESMFNISNLAHLGGLSDGLKFSDSLGNNDFEDDESQPALKQIEADFSSPKSKPRPGAVGDILSEIQVTEVQKLEKLLEQSEHERTKHQSALHETQRKLEDAQKELVKLNKRSEKIREEISNMAALDLSAEKQVNNDKLSLEIEQEEDPEKKALLILKKKLLENESVCSTFEKEITDLKTQLSCLQNSNTNGRESQSDEANTLGATQEELVNTSDNLSLVYHLICEMSGSTPNRVVLDHAKAAALSRDIRGDKNNDTSISNGEAGEKARGSPSRSPDKESSDLLTSLQNIMKKDDPNSSCYILSQTINDQVKYLREAVDHLMDVTRQNVDGDGDDDLKEVQEQVVKLKAMLSTKREQIATLRSVLKANKSTAEVALANLKQKYENEKVIVTETMMKLRNELKALKEDAATFASLRAMFAQRCDEYVTQLDEQQRQLTAAEEEKKTLNSLLRMAIQQKLVLTQRLEDLEFDRER